MDIYVGELVEGQHSTRSAGKLVEDANTSVFKGCQGRVQSQTTLSSKPGFSIIYESRCDDDLRIYPRKVAISPSVMAFKGNR